MTRAVELEIKSLGAELADHPADSAQLAARLLQLETGQGTYRALPMTWWLRADASGFGYVSALIGFGVAAGCVDRLLTFLDGDGRAMYAIVAGVVLSTMLALGILAYRYRPRNPEKSGDSKLLMGEYAVSRTPGRTR